jgi:HD-GYP domain-containing protein (c-di-GMP phosphodiesterase class II)
VQDQIPVRRLRLPLYVLAALGVTVLITVIVGGFASLTYRDAQAILLDASTETTRRFTEATVQRLQTYLGPERSQMAVMAYSNFGTAAGIDQRLKELPMVVEALDRNPNTDALFVAYPNGEFILFRRLRDDAARQKFNAPARAEILVQSETLGADGTMAGEYRFFDIDLRLIETRPVADYRYDPRERAWYRLADRQAGITISEPYVFFTTRSIGVTVARKSPDGRMIVGLDVTLEKVGDYLDAFRTTPSTEIALVGPRGRVVGYIDETRMTRVADDGSLNLVTLPELGVPVLRQAESLIGTADGRRQVIVDRHKWQVTVKSIPVAGMGSLTLLIAIPEEELFAGARDIIKQHLVYAFFLLLAFLPVGLLGARLLARPLARLARETKAIAAFDFAEDVKVPTVVAEVDDLGNALGLMKKTIRKFLDIGQALAAESDFRALLDRVLREGIGLVESDGGAIFMLSEGDATLRPEILRSRLGQLPVDEMPVRSLALDGDGIEGEIRLALRDGRIAVIERRLTEPEIGLLGLGALVLREQAVRVALVIVPLFDRRHKVLGALILFKAIRAGEDSWAVSDQLVELIHAVSGSAGMAIENQMLLRAQKDLMNALIKLIAGAIDAKSSYTGSHCARVPVLTRMLAEAACAKQNGPFGAFNLTSEEWEAVEIGSWLHDCGKVTTPEHVVDKATKLETIYDRIHEIRMRVEVLKRDAEIAYWRDLAAGGDEASLRAVLERERRQLDDDFAFIAMCNEGGEFMDPAHVARLREIAGRRWRRTLSDRIGISEDEKVRKGRTPAPDLPVDEPLLADRDDHISHREVRDRLGADSSRGFRVDMPEYRMNRGEIYNLSIGRGTLTDEERYIINDHIAQSIIMLESLPLPRHLRSVPEIAGGHHEKMNGTGYPRRLTRDDMSPVARMMAIADVFEALTASDRPYKKAKKLSEAIRIMGFMKKDHHLDPDLLDLFLADGIWKRYAEQFLEQGQIDEPDIAAVLRMRPS